MFKYIFVAFAFAMWCGAICVSAFTRPNCTYSPTHSRNLCGVAEDIAQDKQSDFRKQYDPDISINTLFVRNAVLKFSGKLDETREELMHRKWGHSVSQEAINKYLAGHINNGLCTYGDNREIRDFITNGGKAEYVIYGRNKHGLGKATITEMQCVG